MSATPSPDPRASAATSRVAVRPLGRENFAAVAAWLSDPEVNRLLTAEWRGRAVDPAVIAIAVRNRRNVLWEVLHEGRLAGLVAFSEYEPRDRSAMVWYLLGDRTLSGRGVTTEAVRLMCEHGFRDLGLASVWAVVLAPNAASVRVLRKCGFREAGRVRRSECADGEQVDRLLFDLLPGEAAAARPGG